MSRAEITSRPSNGHPVKIHGPTKVFKFLTLTVRCDMTEGLWELRELRTSAPVGLMSVVAKHTRPEEHAALLCEEYQALFEAPGEGDHLVTQDEDCHTATVMHMILPHLASQIRDL